MPIPAVRTIDNDTVRNFGKIQADYEISDLTRIQTESYSRFLQLSRSARDRRDQGLEEILREVFPVESYDGQIRLDAVRWRAGCRPVMLGFLPARFPGLPPLAVMHVM